MQLPNRHLPYWHALQSDEFLFQDALPPDGLTNFSSKKKKHSLHTDNKEAISPHAIIHYNVALHNPELPIPIEELHGL